MGEYSVFATVETRVVLGLLVKGRRFPNGIGRENPGMLGVPKSGCAAWLYDILSLSCDSDLWTMFHLLPSLVVWVL